MRRASFTIALMTLAGLMLAIAPVAQARDDGGQGFYGETTDSNITSMMFLALAFFPVLILVLTLIQTRLDKRKHARMDAAKARAANADWRGGW